MIVVFGVMIALNPWLPRISALGSLLVVLMSFTTLSFLITTPECWVPSLGSSEHGFPLLSGAGRLVVKDAIYDGRGHGDDGRLGEVLPAKTEPSLIRPSEAGIPEIT